MLGGEGEKSARIIISLKIILLGDVQKMAVTPPFHTGINVLNTLLNANAKALNVT